MNLFAAPFSLLLSLLLLLVGGMGLLEAQSECTGLCFFNDQVSAGATGLALFIVGLFNLSMAVRLGNDAADAAVTSAAAKSAESPVTSTNAYAELNKAHSVPSLDPNNGPPDPWNDQSPGARRS